MLRGLVEKTIDLRPYKQFNVDLFHPDKRHNRRHHRIIDQSGADLSELDCSQLFVASVSSTETIEVVEGGVTVHEQRTMLFFGFDRILNILRGQSDLVLLGHSAFGALYQDYKDNGDESVLSRVFSADPTLCHIYFFGTVLVSERSNRRYCLYFRWQKAIVEVGVVQYKARLDPGASEVDRVCSGSPVMCLRR